MFLILMYRIRSSGEIRTNLPQAILYAKYGWYEKEMDVGQVEEKGENAVSRAHSVELPFASASALGDER